MGAGRPCWSGVRSGEIAKKAHVKGGGAKSKALGPHVWLGAGCGSWKPESSVGVRKRALGAQ